MRVRVLPRRRAIAWPVLLIGALLSASMATDSVAGPVSELAVEADALMQEGKPLEALDAFDQAGDALWQGLPLQCRTAAFARNVTGFRQYRPRLDSRFRSGETATIYLEPVGYGFLETTVSSYRIALSARVEIRTPDGLTLALTDGFGDLTWEGRSRSRQIHASVVMSLPELKPSDYVLRLILTDRATDQQTAIALPFSIVE